MAASNLFKNNESLSNVSGILNPAINDSSASIPPESSNSSSSQNNELIDLEMNNLNNIKNIKQQQNLDNNLNNQLNLTNNQNQQMDIILQNYLYDYKTFQDDNKSLASVQTSKSTRERFDFLSRILPIGILMLICFLMIHFVCYVRDIEPFTQITEIICIVLAFLVFTLSSVFIVRIFCDSNDKNSDWTNNLYSEEYIYTPNIYNDNLQDDSQLKRTYLNQNEYQDQDIRKQTHFYIEKNGNIYATNLAGLEFKNKIYSSNLDNPITEQFANHSLPYINYSPNQLNTNQRINQFNNQRSNQQSNQVGQLNQANYSPNQSNYSPNQSNQPNYNLNQVSQLNQINQLNQLNQMSQMSQMNQINQMNQMNQINQLNQLNQQLISNPKHHRTNSISQQYNTSLINDKKIQQKFDNHAIQTINLNEEPKRRESLIKETST